MFRIVIYVDDTKVGKALWALTAVPVLRVETPQPVANAIQKKGGQLAARTNGTSQAMFAEYVKGRKTVGPSDIREFCSHHGLSEKSYSNVLDTAIKNGVLKRRTLPKSKQKGLSKYFYEVVS